MGDMKLIGQLTRVIHNYHLCQCQYCLDLNWDLGVV